MKLSKRAQSMIGTVSHGTMRNEDLIPAFADVLRALATSQRDLALVDVCDLLVSVNFADCEPGELSDVTNDLFDALNDYAPGGCYFGAHPGDGSDYGFWPFED